MTVVLPEDVCLKVIDDGFRLMLKFGTVTVNERVWMAPPDTVTVRV